MGKFIANIISWIILAGIWYIIFKDYTQVMLGGFVIIFIVGVYIYNKNEDN